MLQRFTSPEHAQPLLAPFGPIGDRVRPRRHRLSAPEYHRLLRTRFAEGQAVTGLAAAEPSALHGGTRLRSLLDDLSVVYVTVPPVQYTLGR